MTGKKKKTCPHQHYMGLTRRDCVYCLRTDLKEASSIGQSRTGAPEGPAAYGIAFLFLQQLRLVGLTMTTGKLPTFESELTSLINKYSLEKYSNEMSMRTADYILAEYLSDCLKAFERAVQHRRISPYGREALVHELTKDDVKLLSGKPAKLMEYIPMDQYMPGAICSQCKKYSCLNGKVRVGGLVGAMWFCGKKCYNKFRKSLKAK